MFSYGPGGEHSTSVAGEGRHPSTKEFNKLAELSDITRVESEGIIGEVRESVRQWPNLTRGIRGRGAFKVKLGMLKTGLLPSK